MSLFNQNIFNQNLFNPMQDIKVYAFIGTNLVQEKATEPKWWQMNTI